jgi:hypothetical protein
MARTGSATLPLHYGKAPRWLFERMAALARQILAAIVAEAGQGELLKRLSDPYWFQTLGCVLGFDWHSSGVTTTVTGALKQGLTGMERELGLYIAGGKGAASRKTPQQIEQYSSITGLDPAQLVHASRLSAKVDSTAVQDGHQLYHHVFVFTAGGKWAVVQQGMDTKARTARRYHWLSDRVADFVDEPHAAVCSKDRGLHVLNMTAHESAGARDASAELAREHPDRLVREYTAPMRHQVSKEDIKPENLRRILVETYETQPVDFEALLGIRGVGPKSIRALSLLSELLYGKAPSWRDPARFSFAHGGKDGTPYPVDRRAYDRTILVMRRAIESARVGNKDKIDAVKRLHRFYTED